MTDHHEIGSNSHDPIEAVAAAIKGFIAQGYIREPRHLTPTTILCNLDVDTADCVLIDAIEKALQLLSTNGVIVDSGEKVECRSCGALETAWIVTAAKPARQTNLH